jgi:crotonobetainyl-CoA:carnitine CoA-transferase CaiB-like acyl-CoA transferase
MLHGVRVLDMTRVLAGPLAAMMLGDLGADVIKVERPGAGDESRGWGPPFDDRGESAYYLSANRNKLSIALDLDAAGDRTILYDLIAGADVVVDNFVRGALERRGISPDTLVARHEQLIWCTLTGFGPESDRPGYDFVVQAESGWMAITGEPDGVPMKVGIALADIVAGKDTAIAILGALVGRSRPGQGNPPSTAQRRLHTSLSDSARAALINVAQNHLVSGQEARRWGNAHANLVPYQLFSASDRHLVLAVGNDAQWLACCRTVGLRELETDAALRTNAGRLANRARVVAALAARLAERPAAEWVAKLTEAGVPSGVIQTVPEALAGSQASALTGLPPSVPGTVRRPPPRLDEHGPLIRSRGWAAFNQPA